MTNAQDRLRRVGATLCSGIDSVEGVRTVDGGNGRQMTLDDDGEKLFDGMKGRTLRITKYSLNTRKEKIPPPAGPAGNLGWVEREKRIERKVSEGIGRYRKVSEGIGRYRKVKK